MTVPQWRPEQTKRPVLTGKGSGEASENPSTRVSEQWINPTGISAQAQPRFSHRFGWRSEVCGNHLIPDTPAVARGRGPSGITSCSASTVASAGSSFVRLSVKFGHFVCSGPFVGRPALPPPRQLRWLQTLEPGIGFDNPASRRQIGEADRACRPLPEPRCRWQSSPSKWMRG